jgi:RNA polymerase-binding transcription factor DksA
MKKKFDKKFITQQKEKLEKEKEKLETQLSSFAEKSKKGKGNWTAKMPRFDSGHLEEEADQVEEYGTLLALERSLENSLKDINLALEKIEKGKYGTCEKCKKPISLARLKVYPQARYCKKCQ